MSEWNPKPRLTEWQPMPESYKFHWSECAICIDCPFCGRPQLMVTNDYGPEDCQCDCGRYFQYTAKLEWREKD